MFGSAVVDLAPWTERGMFDNVIGQGFSDGYGDQDVSMTAVARALFSRRLPEDEKFRVKLANLGSGDDIVHNTLGAINDIIYTATDGEYTSENVRNTIIVSQYTGNRDFDQIHSLVISGLVLSVDGWKIHDKAELFLNREMKSCVVINEERQSAIIITDKLTMQHWHFMISILPAYVPKLFKEQDLDNDEKAVLKSLTTRSQANFISAIAALEEKYDIRGKKIRNLITGFEARAREHQIEAIEQQLEEYDARLRNLMDQYREILEQKDDANVRRNGLKYMIGVADNEEELVQFFQLNKSLDVVSVRNNTISFIVRTYFENFDAELYERCRENGRFLEESVGRGVFAEAENRKKIMDAMFITEKIKLRMCALYHLDVRGNISTTSGYSYPPNCADYIPNYHLDTHSCFGDYRRVIEGYLRNGDTIGAINACIASAKSVNIGESGPTFNPMMQNVFCSNKKCFDLPDGTHVTPAEALKWLNEQEAAE